MKAQLNWIGKLTRYYYQLNLPLPHIHLDPKLDYQEDSDPGLEYFVLGVISLFDRWGQLCAHLMKSSLSVCTEHSGSGRVVTYNFEALCTTLLFQYNDTCNISVSVILWHQKPY